MNHRPTTCGHTLVEIVIAGTVFAVISTGIFSLMGDAGGVFHSALRASTARRHCADVARALAGELAGANPANLAIDATHAEGDRLQLQVPLSVTNGVVDWGATEAIDRSGSPQPNAFVSYELAADPARPNLWCLVRRIVGVGGAPLGQDQTVVDHVDAPGGASGKGFSVARNGDLVTLTLRVRESANDSGSAGDDAVRSQQMTVKLRNP